MKYKRFEDLPVWNDAIKLSVSIFRITEDKSFRHKGDIANQIQRSGLSVPNNIAEGFERGTNAELITFLYYARGSAGEVRSILCVCERMPAFGHLKSEISDLKGEAESISRQIRAWAESLQNSDIRGQRYLTDRSRSADERKKQASEFMEDLKKRNELEAKKRKTERRERD